MISSEETQAAQRKSKQLKRRIMDLQKRKKAVDARLETLEKKYNQLLEEANSQKAMLEKSTHKILKEPINIKLNEPSNG